MAPKGESQRPKFNFHAYLSSPSTLCKHCFVANTGANCFVWIIAQSQPQTTGSSLFQRARFGQFSVNQIISSFSISFRVSAMISVSVFFLLKQFNTSVRFILHTGLGGRSKENRSSAAPRIICGCCFPSR